MTYARKIDKEAGTLAIAANSMNTNEIDAICYTGLIEDVAIHLHQIAEMLRTLYPDERDEAEYDDDFDPDGTDIKEMEREIYDEALDDAISKGAR